MIVVFGSINVDIEMHLERLPRPGETVLGAGYGVSAGGKGGNQALAAALAGSHVRMFGCVGRDEFAEPALGAMRRGGVDLAGVRETDRPTGLATVWVDAVGENSIAVASGANREARADMVPVAALGRDTLLVLQMETPDREVWQLIDKAKPRGARIVLNLAPAVMAPPAILAKIDYLIVNEGEAKILAHELDLEGDNPRAIPRRIVDRFGTTTIMTMGGAGLICAHKDGGWLQPALPISPVDTTGAGDAVTGAFAAAIDQRQNLLSALKWAAVAGGIACTRKGAQEALANRAEIEAALPNLPPESVFG